MNLVSMQHQAGEGQQGLATPIGSEYPCGLRLHLQEQQLKALGIEELPPAGTHLRLEACVVVTRSSTEDPDADGDIDYVCVELQVTELGLEEDGAGEDDEEDLVEQRSQAAQRLYAKKG